MDGVRTTLCLLFTSATLACSAAAGCSVDDGGAPPPNNDPYYSTAPRTSQYDAGADPRGDDAGYAPVVTTSADDDNDRDGPPVPKTARLEAEGRGDLSYKAPRDGYVYVVDHRDRRLIYEGPLYEGETLLIAPYRNVIEVDGKRVKKVKDLENKHIHRVFFERNTTRRRDRDRRDR
jgi:hypothetical protein